MSGSRPPQGPGNAGAGNPAQSVFEQHKLLRDKLIAMSRAGVKPEDQRYQALVKVLQSLQPPQQYSSRQLENALNHMRHQGIADVDSRVVALKQRLAQARAAEAAAAKQPVTQQSNMVHASVASAPQGHTMQQQQQQAPQQAPRPPFPVQPGRGLPLPSGPNPFSSMQVMQLKAQIMAFKLLSRQLPVPADLLNAARGEALHRPPGPSHASDINRSGVPPATAGAMARGQVAVTTAPGTRPASDAPAMLLQQGAAAAPGVVQSRVIRPPSTAAGKQTAQPQQQQQKPAPVPRQLTMMQRAQRVNQLLVRNLSQRVPIKALSAEREARIAGQRAARIQLLQAKLDGSADSMPREERVKLLCELKALMLLARQRALRKVIKQQMEDEKRMFSNNRGLSRRKMARDRRRETKSLEKQEKKHRAEAEARRKTRHQTFLRNILNAVQEFKRFHSTHRSLQGKTNKALVAYHIGIEKRRAAEAERREKDRIRALKENDTEAYMKLVEESKNERLLTLLNQTDSYLKQIGAMVEAGREGRDEDEEMSPKKRKAKMRRDAAEVAAGARDAELAGDADAMEALRSGKDKYYSLAHNITEEVTEQPKMLVGGTLKPYQILGLQWLVSLYNNGLNGILADEMGLGKTIQSIALLTYLMEVKGNKGPFLVVVPLSTLSNWRKEFERWAPDITMVVYKGTPNVRKGIQQTLMSEGKYNVLLTTYEYVMKDKSFLAKVFWQHLIVDEGHRMKNHNCKLVQIFTYHYRARHRLLLTGTPLQNNLPELWSLLNFLLPKIFNSVDSFEQWFAAPFKGTEDVEVTEEEQLLVINRLHQVLRPFLLRRLKTEVESQLPDKVEHVIRCELSAMQKVMYDRIRSGAVLRLSQSKGKTRSLQNTVMQLRKIVNHPYLFEEADEASHLTDDSIWRVAGKFELLDRLLPKLKASGHRVLMFSQMTQVMTVMEDYLNYRDWRYMRLDGMTKAEDRSELLERFNAPDSPFFIFLLSTRAGGLGLNLQTADTVILFDSDWNPHMDLQAQDRAHRIGQTNEVRVLRLITCSPVEEQILRTSKFKLDVDAKVIQAGRFDTHSTQEDRRAMLERLVRGGTDEVDTDEVPTDETLNEMIGRSDEEMELFAKMDKEREEAWQREWEQSGGQGKAPPRLIAHQELPEWLLRPTEELQAEYDRATGAVVDADDFGRGRRARSKVVYNDNLSERQWLNAIESGGDLAEAIDRKRNSELRRASRRSRAGSRASSRVGSDSDSDDDDSVSNLSTSDTGAASATTSGLSSSESVPDQPMALAPPPAPPVPADLESGTVGITQGLTPAAASTGDVAAPAPAPASGEAAPVKKPRKKRVRPELTEAEKEAITECIRAVNETNDEDGRAIAAPFRKLPDKTTLPEYYTVISKPMDLNRIKAKIRRNGYYTLPDVVRDVQLCWDNARVFNPPDSLYYNDANTLEMVWKSELLQRGIDANPPPKPAPAAAAPKLKIKLSLPAKEAPASEDAPASAAVSTGDGSSTESEGEESEDSEAPMKKRRLA